MATRKVPLTCYKDGKWSTIGEAELDTNTGFFEGTMAGERFSGFAGHMDTGFVQHNGSFLEQIAAGASIGFDAPDEEVTEIGKYPGPNRSVEEDKQDWEEAKDAGSPETPMPDASRYQPDE